MFCRVAQCFLVRKLMEHELEAAGLGADEAYFCSLSSRTIVYKGQLKPDQVRAPLRMPSACEAAQCEAVCVSGNLTSQWTPCARG